MRRGYQISDILYRDREGGGWKNLVLHSSIFKMKFLFSGSPNFFKRQKKLARKFYIENLQKKLSLKFS